MYDDEDDDEKVIHILVLDLKVCPIDLVLHVVLHQLCMDFRKLMRSFFHFLLLIQN